MSFRKSISLNMKSRRVASTARRFNYSIPKSPIAARGINTVIKQRKETKLDKWIVVSSGIALLMGSWLNATSSAAHTGWWPFRDSKISAFDDPVLRKALKGRKVAEAKLREYLEAMRSPVRELFALRVQGKVEEAEFIGRLRELSEEVARETQRITYGILDPPDARRRYEMEHGCCRHTPEAIRVLAGLSPIVEIGGGRGHWQKALTLAGISVVSFDNGVSPHPMRGLPPVGQVLVGDETVLERYPEKTLLLVYPPEGDMALRCTHEFRGDCLVYVGEARGGVNACDEFFDLMDAQWEAEKILDLDPFPQCFERLYVMRRKLPVGK
ncbi:unnamed protein product, partial [Discosporangium mesarthrocarpum]